MAHSKQTLGKMHKVHKVAMDCIVHLVTQKGYTADAAETMVMATLKESEHYLRNGLIDETIATLKMVHMDQTVESAAAELIKNLIK